MLKLGRPRGNRVKGGGSRPKRGREDPTRGQGRRTQRCAQPRARLGVQALADPELRMSLLNRRAHKATVGCRALGLRGFLRGSVCPGRPPLKWPDRRDAGWPMSHGGGGPPELLPGQVRWRRRREAGAGSFWREHEPGWDRGPGRGPGRVAARAASGHRGGVGCRRA